jgi:hypothetical protein
VIDAGRLLADLQRHVRLLETDLRSRVTDEAQVRGCWERDYRDAYSAQRTGLGYEVWRDQRITQVAAGWVLACVFTRFCEDNQLLDEVWLAGPAERLAEARGAGALRGGKAVASATARCEQGRSKYGIGGESSRGYTRSGTMKTGSKWDAFTARTGSLTETIRRPWLEERIEAAITAGRGGGSVVLLVGEPGSGKTVVASQLASEWACPCAILRAGSADSALAADPKNAIVALGVQIRARYGADAFGPPAVELTARVDVNRAAPTADAAAARIGAIRVSPFKRVLIDAEISVSELEGTAAAIEIGSLQDVIADLSPARLAEEAIADPLRRLAYLRPGEAVRMIVDGLDESPELARALPFGADLPPNGSWLLTSRPGSHLDRFVTQAGFDVVRVDLREADAEVLCVDDAMRHVAARLDVPAFRAALERSPYAVRPVGEIARTVAEASGGNFLYVYHWLREVEQAASANALPAALLAAADLPRGLDGIYRYLVSARIRGPAGRAWSSTYVPALGALAVAREPLSSTRIAQFAGTDPESVDDVLRTIEQLIETASVDGDLGYALYHRSFGEFLLGQDRSRNPTPLQPAAAYHRRIATSCVAVNHNWSLSDDGYALAHLAHHLAESGSFFELRALMTGPFAKRQSELLGSEAALGSCEFGARRAAYASRDDAMLDLLARRTELEADFAAEWESGEFVVSLLGAQVPAQVVQRFGPAVPWSAFLAAERLLDLNEPEKATRMLDDVARKQWPAHRPEPPRSFGLGEGSTFDLPDRDVAEFLGRVAANEPELALRLTDRLYLDAVDRLPNRQSAWRDVLLAVLDSDPASATARRITEATVAWLSDRRPALGAAGLAEGLFSLLARAAESYVRDEDSLARRAAFALRARLRAPNQTAADVPYGNIAGALDGMLAIHDALPPASRLRPILRESVAATAAKIPPVDVPTTPVYQERAAALGRLAHVLARIDGVAASAAAEAALAACALDGATGDPPLHEVATGLVWLLRSGGATAERARSVVDELDVAEHVARAERQLDRPWQPDRPDRDGTVGERLAAVFGPYARGRLALSLADAADVPLGGLGASLRAASAHKAKKPGDEPPPSVKDIAAEALASALVPCPAVWVPDEIHKLLAARATQRRTDVQLDEGRLRLARWSALSAAGARERLEAEVLAAHAAIPPDDVNGQLDCCWGAIHFDPDLADGWWATLADKLNPLNRGGAIVVLVLELLTEHPERLDDLGRRWIGGLPKREPGEPVAAFELRLCRWWSYEPRLHATVAGVLSRLAASVRSEFERVPTNRSDDGWPNIGRILRAAGSVRQSDGAAAHATERVADAVLSEWRSRSDRSKWATGAAGILEGFLHIDDSSIVAGHAVDAAKVLLAEVAKSVADDDSVDVEFLSTKREVALRAAARLKDLDPALARRVFDAESSRWERAIDKTTLAPAGDPLKALHGIFAAAIDRKFGSPQERMLFTLTNHLCAWCAAPPVELEGLATIQRRIGRLDDVDLRALLMGPVAAAWLKVDQLARTAAVANAATTRGLELAGFYKRLPAVARAANGELDRGSLLLEAVVRTITEGAGSAEDALRSWFVFRARDTAGKGLGKYEVDPAYLRGLVDWVRGHDGGRRTMDPITLTGVGAVVISEGVKFLYGQAGELLKSWRNRRQKGDGDEPPRLEAPPPDLLDGSVQPAVANLDTVGRFEDELRELWQALAPYAAGIEDIDEHDAELLAATDSVRRILEAVFEQRITFRGERREPSGPVVIGEANIDAIAGDVAGVRARLISSGRITGIVKAKTAEKGAHISGVEAGEIR